jgi:hypothetical protein
MLISYGLVHDGRDCETESRTQLEYTTVRAR